MVEEALELGDWERKTPTIKAYIDDYNVIECVRATTALSHFSTNAAKYEVRATQSDEILKIVKGKSAELGCE